MRTRSLIVKRRWVDQDVDRLRHSRLAVVTACVPYPVDGLHFDGVGVEETARWTLGELTTR